MARNSNIELLRILAMLCIALNHFTWMYSDILGNEVGLRKYALLNTLGLISNFGGVGDVLFFAISAWFLCAENIVFKRSCRRIWMLEQRMLFYSIGLLMLSVGLFCGIGYGNLPSNLELVASFFPCITGRWWYTTSYVVFLLLHPFIHKGLRAMGRQWHKRLVTVSLLAWGIIPYYDINMGYGIFLFMYLYSIVSYIRWYRLDLLNSRQRAWKMIIIGFILGFGSNSIAQLFSSNSVVMAFWMNKPRCIPSLLMALGLFSLAVAGRRFGSSIVNRIAGGTLAMYLLQGFLDPFCVWLFDDYLSGMHGFALIGINIVMAVGCYAVALTIDQFRQLLFNVVFRRPGRWFEIYYNKIVPIIRFCNLQVSNWLK